MGFYSNHFKIFIFIVIILLTKCNLKESVIQKVDQPYNETFNNISNEFIGNSNLQLKSFSLETGIFDYPYFRNNIHSNKFDFYSMRKVDKIKSKFIQLRETPSSSSVPETKLYINDKNSKIDKDTCLIKANTLFNMIDHDTPFTKATEYYRTVYVYSGRNFGDLGDYDRCNKFPEGKFFSTIVQVTDEYSTRFGLCFFIECDEDTLASLKPQLKLIISKLMKFNIKDFTFTDTSDVASSQYQSHYIGAYIVISIVIIILLLYIMNAVMITKASPNKTSKREIISKPVNPDFKKSMSETRKNYRSDNEDDKNKLPSSNFRSKIFNEDRNLNMKSEENDYDETEGKQTMHNRKSILVNDSQYDKTTGDVNTKQRKKSKLRKETFENNDNFKKANHKEFKENTKRNINELYNNSEKNVYNLNHNQENAQKSENKKLEPEILDEHYPKNLQPADSILTVKNIKQDKNHDNKDLKSELKGEETKKPFRPKKSLLNFILSHFDFYEQLSKIFTVKAKSNDPLRIFDGIRIFSAGWVVFGHGFYLFIMIGFYNSFEIINLMTSWMGAIIYSALFAVDVFFYMSAFMFYLGMQKYISKPETSNINNVNKDYWSTSDYRTKKGNENKEIVDSNPNETKLTGQLVSQYEVTEFRNSKMESDTSKLPNSMYDSIRNSEVKSGLNNINNSNISKSNDNITDTKVDISNSKIENPVKEKKTSKIIVFSMALVARYIRLFPLYAFVIFGITQIVPMFAYGGLDYMTTILNDPSCANHWWHNILYFNNLLNYTPPDSMCAGHTWYLANDMQFFIVFMLIFVFLAEYDTIRNLVVLAIMIASLAISTVLCINQELNYNDRSHNRKVNPNEFNEYYIKPYIRVAPYILGLFFCEFYLNCKAYPKYVENSDTKKDNIFRKINKKIEKNNLVAFLMFIFAMILINFSVFSTWWTNNYDVNLPFQGVMKTFNKVLFVWGLAILVQLTFLGKFKIIYHILSLDLFNVLGKLTFGIYLVHMYIILIAGTHFNSLPYLNFWFFSIFAVGALGAATIVSLIVSLLFESPVISILKSLMGRE